MKLQYLIVLLLTTACATGGTVGGDGTATGGSVNVRDITTCLDMPGAASEDCKKKQ